MSASRIIWLYYFLSSDVAWLSSVADLQASLNETLSNPFKYAFLVHNHENIIDQICSSSRSNVTSSQASSSKPARSRKRKRAERSTGEDKEGDNQLHPDALHLKNQLENIALSCWPYVPTNTTLLVVPDWELRPVAIDIQQTPLSLSALRRTPI